MQNLLNAVRQWLAGRAEKPIGIWVLALGASMTLGFAPFNAWFVAVASLGGLWWLINNAKNRQQAAAAAFVWGLGHQVTALYWLPWAFFKDAGGSWVAAIGGGVPAVLGLAAYGALAYALAASLAWKRGAWVWVLSLVVIEFVKGLHPMGFPWLPVGAVFANWTYLAQGAALGGVWLLSLILLTLSVMVTRGRQHIMAAAGIVVIMAAVGYARVATTPMSDGPDVVRVVQPNIQSAHKWDAQKRWQFLQETMQVALAGDPSVTVPATVVMPETAVAFYIDEEDDVRRALTQAIDARLPANGGLVTGTVRRALGRDAEEHYFNSLTVLNTQGELVNTYDKRLLVPFGEYIPGRNLLEKLPLPMTLRTFSQSRIDFTHGTKSPVLKTPAGLAVGLICYEGIFPLQVGQAAAEARYLVNITNDGWFTGTIALYQHAALARLRAIETGLPMVRVANTGLTLVYDGVGRELLRLPINAPVYADVALPEPLPETVFVKWVKLLAFF